jgi:serine/threonine protein kinase/tetratricopeptide (TPR) repeat protein
MNRSHWQAVTELYHAAREQQGENRRSFLSERCSGNDALRQEVEDLLRADDEARGFLGGDAVEQALRAIDDVEQRCIGTIVGSYRILQQIGHGGMGAVYLAERTDDQFHKHVAVKLIKRGMDTDAVLRRFHDERKILAELDHPNIARLIDGGTTADGRPYFLMEYVDGRPIDRYCDECRLGVDDRLRLFLKVCAAVSYAHQHLVIHRDIKPSNILVMPDGSPKLLDFGIAKVMHAEHGGDTVVTAAFMRPMTPEYTSPEQLQGAPSTTLSDVYSLGVLLFEMLVGHTPFEFPSRTPDDIVRVVTGSQAPKASEALARFGSQRLSATDADAIANARGTTVDRLRRCLAGDLDTIASMALRTEPERRYQSVGHLAEDIGRHLSGLAILARKDQALYRATKFVRRHQAGVGAALLVSATLVFGFGATIWQAIRATRAERAAVVERDRAATAQTAATTERDRALRAENAATGARVDAEQERNRAQDESRRADSEAAVAKAVSEFLQNDLLAQASSAVQAGAAARPDPNLTVRAALDRAAARIGGKFEDRPEIEAAIRRTIGMTYSDLGQYAEAEQHLKRAVELQQRILGAGHSDTLATMSQLGMIYTSTGKNAEAEVLMSKVLLEQRRLFGDNDIRTVDAMNNLAIAASGLGRHTEAERIYLRMLAIERRANGEEHAETLAVMNNLAVEYINEGRYAQAEEICKQTLDLKRRVLGEEHPSTLRTSNQLGIVYRNEGKYAEAESVLSSTLEARRRVMGMDHPDTLSNLSSLALVYQAEAKYAQAEPLIVQVIESRRRSLGEQHPLVIASMNNLADLNHRAGKLKDAETRFAEVLELRRRVLGPDHPNTLSVVTSLAAVKFDERDYAEAEGLLRQAMSGYERGSTDSWQRYYAQSLLGATLARRDRVINAEPLLTSGYQGLMSRQSAIPFENRGVLDDARRWLAEFVK